MTRAPAQLERALIGLVAVALAAPCLFAPLFDDAYIHARLAQHLLESGRPDFNAGAGLKTDSATGYLLLVAAVSALVRDPVLGLRAIQAASLALFVVQLWRFVRVARERTSAVDWLLFGCALPPVLWAAYGGMETSLAAALLVSCAGCALRGEERAALLYASLAACVRIELVVFVAFVLARRLAAGAPLARLLPLLAPLALCAVFDLVHYGTLLPQAALAKSLAYDLPLGEAARLALSVSFERHALLLGGLYVASLALALYLRADLGLSALDGLMLQTVALLLAWTAGRSIMFPWYVATYSVCISLLALRARQPSGELVRSPRVARVYGALLCVLSVALGLLSARTVFIDLGLSRAELASGVRAQRYLSLAGPLYRHCPTCSLASSEIGALGWAFRGTVFDALGLADRDASAFHPLSVPEQRASYRVGAIPPAYIALRAPEFVISMPLFSEAFRRSAVARSYTVYDCPLVPEQPERRLWGDAVIQVFAKRALPAALLARMRCALASDRAAFRASL
jgi:hypothetical protein